MTLTSLRCRNFRNLAHLDWSIPQGMVVLVGPNGAGKSNILEAIAVLGNLTSFRPGAPRSWVRHGEAFYLLRGELAGAGACVLEQQGRLGKGLYRELLRNGRRIPPAEYLALFPVATCSAADQELVVGSPEHRRRLLDRLTFHLAPATLDLLLRFRRALRQRNALLAASTPAPQALAAFERELAHTGAALVAQRLAACELLQRALEEELAHLGWLLPKPVLRYHAPEGLAAAAAASELLAQYRRSRPQELARGHTLVGPHRHDLCITLQGRPAREQLSAGQVKLLATALRLATVRVAAERRGVAPLLVFDDVDAELDGETLGRLLRRLGSATAQAVLSTAHPEVVVPRLGEATVVAVREGTVV